MSRKLRSRLTTGRQTAGTASPECRAGLLMVSMQDVGHEPEQREDGNAGKQQGDAANDLALHEGHDREEGEHCQSGECPIRVEPKHVASLPLTGLREIGAR